MYWMLAVVVSLALSLALNARLFYVVYRAHKALDHFEEYQSHMLKLLEELHASVSECMTKVPFVYALELYYLHERISMAVSALRLSASK